ncbi:MAG: oligosaccharide flippase family protein [Candidatus Roizmanbacteria bacterium]|nr:MAG: oligosaccharide flippase family protein [Candidatus Roizmanbacteria bacterium]
MENNELKRRTVISAISLFFQSGYTAMLGFGANIILTILLSPKIFGIFITVLSLISLLNYFSDIGLAASLIQKKEIDKEDIKSTFTIQQILIITLVTLGFLATPFIKSFYNLPLEGVYLYWALLISFFLSSLKTIPSIFLERKIQFQKIVFVQVIENSTFYFIVTILALLNYGLHSFTIAVVARALVGLVAIYIISPWVPKIGISFKHLKHLLSFGVPFQTSSFLALFKDDLIILFLGKALGFEGVGYIGWAKKWAEAPIRIIMDNLSRVLFPVFARIQADKEKTSRLVEKILHYQTILLAPFLMGLSIIMPFMIEFIPKYTKWSPALPIFYLFIVAAFFSSYSTPFINLFNALGKVKISFSFMLIWTIITWIFTPLFVTKFGLYGFPLVQLILSLTSVAVVYKARKMLYFRFFNYVYKPLLSSGVMLIMTVLIINLTTASFFSILLLITVGSISYISSLFLLKINLVTEFKLLFHNE